MPVDIDQYRSLEELRARLDDVKADISALETEFEGKDYDNEAQVRYDTLNEEHDAIEGRIGRLVARQDRLKKVAGDENRSVPGDGSATPAWEKPVQVTRTVENIFDLSSYRQRARTLEEEAHLLRDGAMRAVEKASYPEVVPSKEGAQGRVAFLLDQCDTPDGQLARRILRTGSPQYRAAFRKWMMGVPMTNDEQRAFSLSSTGIPITFTLDPTIIPVSSSVVNPLRAISNVESIVGVNEWRGVTAAAITAARAAEATEASDNTPTLAQPAIVCSRVQAFVPFSVEAEGDWPGMDASLARLFADAKDDEEATAFNSGNGTPPNPFGVLTGATNTVAASTGLTITAANLYALEAALPPRYRPRAQFVANRAMYNIVRALDTAGGAQLWLRIGELIGNAPASSGGNGNTGLRLLGYAVNELSTMASTVTNGTKIVLLGDFSYFKIIDRVGMNVELIPQLFGSGNRYPTGQRGVFAWWRNGSKVLDASAFRALTGTT